MSGRVGTRAAQSHWGHQHRARQPEAVRRHRVAAGDDQAFAAFTDCKRFEKPPLRLALTLRLARSLGTNRAPQIYSRLSR